MLHQSCWFGTIFSVWRTTPASAHFTLETQIIKFHTVVMFARKIRVEYEEEGQRHPAPLKWLDSFSMRSFTNDPVFDDTLPVGDGLLEIGARVPLDRLQSSLQDWWRRKSYLPKGSSVLTTEIS
jgi:hypothetical protein